MKTIITILTIILLTSCGGNYDEKRFCSKGTITVLNKQKYPCSRGGGWCGFNMYIYNGTEANWYSTDEKTYDAYNINDTLPTIVLTIIKKDE